MKKHLPFILTLMGYGLLGGLVTWGWRSQNNVLVILGITIGVVALVIEVVLKIRKTIQEEKRP